MNEPQETRSAWLFDVAAVLGLIGAFIYLTGWTYAYHYFDRFGLGLLELDIPEQYFLMYGFWVYKAWWWFVALFYVLSLFLIAQTVRVENEKYPTGMLARQAQVGLVVFFFIVSGWLARKEAIEFYETQQARGFSAFPYVRVWPEKTASEDQSLKQLYNALPDGAYRLLLRNNEYLYLIKPPGDGRPARVAVSQITLKHLEALRVLP